ncbi:iron-sulfur cluster assembly scaffold protein [Minwuia sp.]|uniref:iron-sulfur cluster assembly scaffold protein n=1 Tax=Minwuia sp. TaxID=2493630 RepID=UPI003A90FDED
MSEISETELLKLAARATGAGRLDEPDGTAKVRNPFCGDRLTMDVRLDGETLSEIGYEIRACLVCQAATSIVAGQMPGRSVSDIAAVGQAVQNYLAGQGDAPEGFAVFEPMQPHLNRHTCVMMPFRAIAEASDPSEPSE